MTPEQRLSDLTVTLQGIQSGWPVFSLLLTHRLDELTGQLIHQDNEQTRGRIKALRELLTLPETLQQERESITAALSEQDAAE